MLTQVIDLRCVILKVERDGTTFGMRAINHAVALHDLS
jgi:hypothetical protein